ncbi:PepSY domain-containing protein [Colwelliaceae bacterium BS250]
MVIFKRKRKIHVRLIKHLRDIHRQLGMALAFFIIFLAITGMLINHGNSLQLDKTKVSLNWLHDHYNISAPEHFDKYVITPKSDIVVAGKQVWLDEQLLFISQDKIISAGTWLQFIIVTTENSMQLYNSAGELVDVMDASAGLPQGIQKLAVQNSQVILHTQNGLYQSNDELYSWQLTTNADATAALYPKNNWFKAIAVTDLENQFYSHQYRSQILTWERVILDIHSGRFFAGIGVLFMDLVAIFLILLSLTGIYIWVRQARARR